MNNPERPLPPRHYLAFPITHDTPEATARRKAVNASSYCGRCGEPWTYSTQHVTHYDSLGCFVLCETCWSFLGSPEARIEYYATLLEWWEANDWYSSDDLEPIRFRIGKAVANGG